MKEFFKKTWVNVTLIMVAVAIMDYFWTRAVGAVAVKDPMLASIYAVLFWLLSAYTTISFVKNPWMLIPVAIGTFVGTYVGVVLL